MAALALLASCGSGTAALFSAADSEDEPQALELRAGDGTPVLHATPAAANGVPPAERPGSLDALRLVFNEPLDPASADPADYSITLRRPDGSEQVQAPVEASVSDGALVLQLAAPLAVHGEYELGLSSQARLRAVSGAEVQDGYRGYFRVYPGAFQGTEVVSSGGSSARFLNQGQAGNAFVRLETVVLSDSGNGAAYAIGSTTALSTGAWDVPSVVYQTPGTTGSAVPFTSLAVHGDTAMLGIKEGNLVGSFQSSLDSLTLRGFPGSVLHPDLPNARLLWPGFELGSPGSLAWRIDRGLPELDDGKHLSWPVELAPVPSAQLPGQDYGRTAAIWWAWTDPTGPSSLDTFGTYGVYANSVSSDPAQASAWPAARRLSGGAGDGTAPIPAWPLSARLGDGRIAVLWNQIEGSADLRTLYFADLATFGGAVYDPVADSLGSDPWSAATTLDASPAPGRLVALTPLGSNRLLAFFRLDRDGEPAPDSGVPEQAEIGVRRLRVQADGSIVDTEGTIATLPSTPTDHYPIPLGYEGSFHGSGPQIGLPAPGSYFRLRRAILDAEIEVLPVTGERFLVTWRGSNGGDQPDDLFLALFDGSTMQWENAGEVIELRSIIGGVASPSSEIRIVGASTDSLGYLTVVWSEVFLDPLTGQVTQPNADPTQPDRISGLRSSGSLLEPGATLMDAFSDLNGLIVELSAYASTSGDLSDGKGVGPADPEISGADGSGHLIVLWSRRLYDGVTGRAIGANAARFR